MLDGIPHWNWLLGIEVSPISWYQSDHGSSKKTVNYQFSDSSTRKNPRFQPGRPMLDLRGELTQQELAGAEQAERDVRDIDIVCEPRQTDSQRQPFEPVFPNVENNIEPVLERNVDAIL